MAGFSPGVVFGIVEMPILSEGTKSMLRKILNDTLWYGLTLSGIILFLFGGFIAWGLTAYWWGQWDFTWKIAVDALEVAWVAVVFAVSWIAARRIMRNPANTPQTNALAFVTLNGALIAGLPFLVLVLFPCSWYAATDSRAGLGAVIPFFIYTLVIFGASALGSALYILIGEKRGEARMTKIVVIAAGAVVLVSMLLFSIAFVGEL